MFFGISKAALVVLALFSILPLLANGAPLPMETSGDPLLKRSISEELNRDDSLQVEENKLHPRFLAALAAPAAFGSLTKLIGNRDNKNKDKGKKEALDEMQQQKQKLEELRTLIIEIVHGILKDEKQKKENAELEELRIFKKESLEKSKKQTSNKK